jgi:hypothetical protein
MGRSQTRMPAIQQLLTRELAQRIGVQMLDNLEVLLAAVFRRVELAFSGVRALGRELDHALARRVVVAQQAQKLAASVVGLARRGSFISTSTSTLAHSAPLLSSGVRLSWRKA